MLFSETTAQRLEQEAHDRAEAEQRLDDERLVLEYEQFCQRILEFASEHGWAAVLHATGRAYDAHQQVVNGR